MQLAASNRLQIFKNSSITLACKIGKFGPERSSLSGIASNEGLSQAFTRKEFYRGESGLSQQDGVRVSFALSINFFTPFPCISQNKTKQKFKIFLLAHVVITNGAFLHCFDSEDFDSPPLLSVCLHRTDTEIPPQLPVGPPQYIFEIVGQQSYRFTSATRITFLVGLLNLFPSFID